MQKTVRAVDLEQQSSQLKTIFRALGPSAVNRRILTVRRKTIGCRKVSDFGAAITASSKLALTGQSVLGCTLLIIGSYCLFTSLHKQKKCPVIFEIFMDHDLDHSCLVKFYANILCLPFCTWLKRLDSTIASSNEHLVKVWNPYLLCSINSPHSHWDVRNKKKTARRTQSLSLKVVVF